MKSINTNTQTVEDTTKDDVKRLAEQEGNTYAQHYLAGKRPLVVHVRGDLSANVAG